MNRRTLPIETYNTGATAAINNDDLVLFKRVFAFLKRKIAIASGREYTDPTNTAFGAIVMEWTEVAYMARATKIFNFLMTNSPRSLRIFAFTEYIADREFDMAFVYYSKLTEEEWMSDIMSDDLSDELCARIAPALGEFIDYCIQVKAEEVTYKDIDDLELIITECNKLRGKKIIKRVSEMENNFGQFYKY